MENRDYYLGFDIGTNSVGWAVTDTDYNLMKFRKKDMWGIRLFSEADTAAERRVKRNTRRRLQRRKQRIKLLQMLFAEEMSQVDPTFFIRLNESKLHNEDKSTEFMHVVFDGCEYNDVDFYREYPTIYHLREDLIKSDEPHDIRAVYIALHHIIKARGHFLIPGDLEGAISFDVAFNQMMVSLNDALPFDLDVTDREKFESILRDNGVSKKNKQTAIEGLINAIGEDEDKADNKRRNNAVKEICKLIAGNQADIRKIFIDSDLGLEDSQAKIKFSDSKYDEQIAPELESLIPDEFSVVSQIKMLYDWSVLVDILDNEEYFSSAKVRQFDTHKKNLKALKALMKKYCDRGEYKDFFDGIGEENNYAHYIGSVKTGGKKTALKKCGEDEFYKKLVKILDRIGDNIDETDRSEFERIHNEAVQHRLLPRQRSKDNSVVPKQVHEKELIKILDNAGSYLPFLEETDNDGISVKEKIAKIFNFRIPYYVGPLSSRHRSEGSNSWMIRREGEDGYIYPWNFEDKVDLERSNEEFIKRMTNKCTYLPWEDVLPKNSLLYQRYMVLNELNNLTIRGRKLEGNTELKQRIYHDLFEKHNSVKGKMLLEYLRKDDAELTLDDLGGFDINFKASLSSYLDFKKKVFGERIAEDHIRDICEDIIRWSTIYGNDKQMLSNVVRKNYGEELSEDQIKAISRLKFTGWGQFSRQLLEGIEGVDEETGEVNTIIGALWNTNNNLMQLLSSRFTFKKEIDTLFRENTDEIKEISYDELVRELYTSPANKRAIWQTIKIAEEVRKIMKSEPRKIFIEMARGGEKDKKRTTSRKQKLLELYNACKDDVRIWSSSVFDAAEDGIKEIESKDEREFSSIKLFLYYTQMGRCAYTGERIDIDALMRGNSRWDRDHIYPQSKIKDDSIDNLVLVRKTVNAKKSNEMISEEVQGRMYTTWKVWLDKGLISKGKFDRLTRKGNFTDDELSGFVARQLVETRQSTKLVTELLERMYKSSKIVRVKAGLVSDFRKWPLGELKSRRVNDYHHAKDAYLNIVVGNVYNTRFTDNPRKWIKGNRDKNWSINKVFEFDIEGAWTAPDRIKREDGKSQVTVNDQGNAITGTIDTVRKNVRKNTVLYTEHTYCKTGEIFNQTVYGVNEKPAIPMKAGLDPLKYGGYKSPGTSYFSQIEFDGKKGERVKHIIGVPIYIANMQEHDPDAFVRYCVDVKGLKNVKVLVPKIKNNSLLIVNGFPMRIRGENIKEIMFKSNMQLIVDYEMHEVIRRIEKWSEKNRKDISEEFDKITNKQLMDLYRLFGSKLEGVYKERPNNQLKTLEKGFDKFERMSLGDKAKVLNEIIKFMRCDAETTGNLSSIGGSSLAGKTVVNKNTISKSNVTLVNQSVTGIYENRIEI